MTLPAGPPPENQPPAGQAPAGQPPPAPPPIDPPAVTRTVSPTPASPANRPLTWLVVLAVVVVGWFVFRPHENKSEQEATRITQAIVSNDMRPVERDFNALARTQLENRGKVGRLSDDLNSLGKLKTVKEDTPKDNSRPLYHHFTATFEKGTRVEDMTYDADGKVASFHEHTSDEAQP